MAAAGPGGSESSSPLGPPEPFWGTDELRPRGGSVREAQMWLEGMPARSPAPDACLVGPEPGPAQKPWLGLPPLRLPLGCDLCTAKGLPPTSATYPPATRPPPHAPTFQTCHPHLPLPLRTALASLHPLFKLPLHPIPSSCRPHPSPGPWLALPEQTSWGLREPGRPSLSLSAEPSDRPQTLLAAEGGIQGSAPRPRPGACGGPE